MTSVQQDNQSLASESPMASRRRFFGKAATAAVAAPLLGAPLIAVAQAPIVFKMQGSWGTNEIFSEMAQQYVTCVQRNVWWPRENRISGSWRNVVKPFGIIDAS